MSQHKNSKINSSVIKLLFILTFFILNSGFSQQSKKILYYKNGQNGIQFIAKAKTGTIIISNFNAKMTIRQDIAKRVYEFYLKHDLKSNTVITITGKEAKVTGKCVITKRGKLITIDFYYQKILWNNGLIEIHET